MCVCERVTENETEKEGGGVPWHPRGDQRKLSIFAMYFLDIILR